MSIIEFTFNQTDKTKFAKEIASVLAENNIEVPNKNTYSYMLTLSRGDISANLDLGSYRFDRNNIFKFERVSNKFLFDSEKVVAWFNKKEKLAKNAVINQNVSTFKWDLLEPFVKGKLEEKEIEYTFEKSRTWRTEEIFNINFEYESHKVCIKINQPCKSELAKLNFDNVLGSVTIDGMAIGEELKVVKFINSLDIGVFSKLSNEYNELIKNNSDIRRNIRTNIRMLESELETLNKTHPKEQTDFVKKELKKIGWL